MGWMLATREAGELAKRLIAETYEKQGIIPRQGHCISSPQAVDEHLHSEVRTVDVGLLQIIEEAKFPALEGEVSEELRNGGGHGRHRDLAEEI
ncbi:MAG: hypothetical protein KKF66_02090 [Actinobacteria bacterium]|nr:hypothetical protein [Actinomycetota bacterium]